MSVAILRIVPSLLIGALLAPLFGCGKAPPYPGESFYAAVAVAEKGEHAEALRLLDEFIQQFPDKPYAYLERAKVEVALQQEDKAIADCEAGLRIEPDHRDLKWYLSELSKPPQQRFKGLAANPPSASK